MPKLKKISKKYIHSNCKARKNNKFLKECLTKITQLQQQHQFVCNCVKIKFTQI